MEDTLKDKISEEISNEKGIEFTTQNEGINTEMLRITPDGRFFVKGIEVESPEEIRDVFAEFAKQFIKCI